MSVSDAVAALSPHSDIRNVVKDYGGGDVDMIRRWETKRIEQEQKV